MGDEGTGPEPIRARSARGRRRQPNAGLQSGPDPILDHAPANEAPLMVRLKDPRQMVEERPKSRLGQLNPFNRGEQTFSTSKAEIKETLKRPLSSLFKRPGSRAGREQQKESTLTVVDTHDVTKDDSFDTKHRKESFDKVPMNLDNVARAPEFTVNHVSDIYNYDMPGFENPEIKKLDDIDMTPLLRFLQLEEEVADEQVPWTWDYLYANILSESREEWDADEDLPDNS